MINLRKITRENIDEVLNLRVNDEQKSYVSTNAESFLPPLFF